MKEEGVEHAKPGAGDEAHRCIPACCSKVSGGGVREAQDSHTKGSAGHDDAAYVAGVHFSHCVYPVATSK